MRTPARRAAVAMLAPLVLAAGCSSADTSPTAVRTETADGSAPPSTAPASPAPTAETAEETPAGAPASSAPTAHSAQPGAEVLTEQTLAREMQAAAEDRGSARYAMTATQAASSSPAMTLDGVIDYGGQGPELSLTMTVPELGDQAGEIRLLGEVMYMAMPPLTPEGKFVRVDLSGAEDPMAEMMAPGDPMSAFGSFAEDLRGVEYLGEESVSGEDLHHYVVSMDGRAVARAMRLGDRLPTSLDYDLWLDDDALMRRLDIAFPGEGEVRIEMWDWGLPVDVQAPPADQVVER